MKRTIMMLALHSVVSMMFAQTCPDSNHPHAIDLGIGVKFACCNVGATSPEQDGGYYAWGETEERSNYSMVSYKHGGNDQHKRYKDIGNDIAGSQYDVAYMKWKGSWRMPTKEQMELLRDRCKVELVKYKRVKGCKFTGPNGNSIFLPAAGSRWYDQTPRNDYSGSYWSSTCSTEGYNGTNDSFFLCFGNGFGKTYVEVNHADRAAGSTIRPVSK